MTRALQFDVQQVINGGFAKPWELFKSNEAFLVSNEEPKSVL